MLTCAECSHFESASLVLVSLGPVSDRRNSPPLYFKMGCMDTVAKSERNSGLICPVGDRLTAGRHVFTVQVSPQKL